MKQIRCYNCGKFLLRPYDERTTFGCSNPESPEPYDPDFFCAKCSKRMYKDLLTKYKCCYRNGDWQKSNAEIKAAKEAGLLWINDKGIVNKYSGRESRFEYIRERDKDWLYIPYLEYEEKRREEKRCKCWRRKNEDDTCPTCSRKEAFCLCKYDANFSW